MDILALWALLLAGLFGGFSCILLIVLLKTVDRLAEVNKKLLILVAGKDQKPEALRALVASDKPPQKKIPGITGKGKNKKNKSGNENYTMEIGVR